MLSTTQLTSVKDAVRDYLLQQQAAVKACLVRESVSSTTGCSEDEAGEAISELMRDGKVRWVAHQGVVWKWTPVIVESPFAGDVERNVRYARACLRDCLLRGEAPFASHLLYTQPGVLDDNDPQERHSGIYAGFAWKDKAEYTVFYTDLGMSRGMALAADAPGTKVFRSIPAWAPVKLTVREVKAPVFNVATPLVTFDVVEEIP